jgi:hypothetical protein
MSINVYTSYYDCKDEVHQKEIIRAIELNSENPKIDAIYLFCEIEYPLPSSKIHSINTSEQPTFATFIQYFQDLYPNDYNVIINSDIVLDYDTTDLIKTIQEGMVYAVTRYEVDDHTYYDPINTWKTTIYKNHSSQDTWAFYNTIINTTSLTMYLGGAACDNRLAALLHGQDLKLINPCLSIKTYHIHSSIDRNYKHNYEFNKLSLFISPCRIEDYMSTVYTKIENNVKTHFRYNNNTIKSVLDTVYNKPKINDLAVGFIIFNSAKSKRILMNYFYTVEKLKLAKIPYYTLELVYDGSSPEIADAFHVRGTSHLFQKEHLCKLLEQRIPESYTKLLFMDADLVYSNPDWYNELSTSLNSYEVVHPFTNALWLDLEYSIIEENRITCVYFKDKYIFPICNSHVGFAWAFQRPYYREVGMYCYAVFGSGDSYSSMQFLNNDYYLKITSIYTPPFTNSYLKYSEGRKPTISHINGNIYHLYHGSFQNRKYSSRFNIIHGIENIEDILIQNEDGVFELTDQVIKDKMREYFIDRNDDEVSGQLLPLKAVTPRPPTKTVTPSQPQPIKNLEQNQEALKNILSNLSPGLFNNPFISLERNLAPPDHWTRFKTT